MNRKVLPILSGVAVLATFAILMACGNSTVTPASPDLTAPPAAVDLPGAGGLSTGSGAELSADAWVGVATIEKAGEFAKAVVTNPAKGPRYLGLICYQGQVHQDEQNRGTKNHEQVRLVPAGETATLMAALNCGNNQCDVTKDLTEFPDNPQGNLEFEAARIPTGRQGLIYHECQPREEGCPPDTMLFEGDGKCWPICEEPKTDVAGLNLTEPNSEKPPEEFVPECICPDGTLETEYGCMTCEEANPPYLSDKKLYQHGSSGLIYGKAQAHNAGSPWTMKLYRGKSYNDWKYDRGEVRSIDNDTVACDDESELKTRTHDSIGIHYYWFVVTRNGEFVYKSGYLKT